MQKYGTETRLLENQLYKAVFKIKGEETTFEFTSTYNPLFSSLKVVRNDFKKLFSDYKDAEILQLMFDNSKLALEISQVEIDPTQDEIPYYMHQYVRYKTELDLLTDIYITLSAKSGLQEKNLGDLKVTKEIKSPRDLEPLMKLVQERLAPWEAELTGMKARPTGATRAGATSEYPLNGRGF